MGSLFSSSRPQQFSSLHVLGAYAIYVTTFNGGSQSKTLALPLYAERTGTVVIRNNSVLTTLDDILSSCDNR